MPILIGMTRDPLKKKAHQRKWYLTHKEHQKARVKRQREEMIRWFNELKSTLKCPCGISHPALITFHHKDPSIKEDTICNGVHRLRWGKERVLKEMAKCTVLCLHCHAILHWEERQNRVLV